MTLTRFERRLRELDAQIARLGAWRDDAQHTLPDWTFQASGQAAVPLAPGEPWPVEVQALREQPVAFSTRWTVPADLDGQAGELELDVGGEALVTATLDGQVVASGGLNPYHRRFPLGALRGGVTLDVQVTAVPRGLFGSPTRRPHLERARVCVPQAQVTALHDALKVTAAAIRTLGREGLEGGRDAASRESGSEVAGHLLNVTEEALRQLNWTSSADAHLARLHDLGGGESFTQGLWSTPATRPDRTALPDSLRARSSQAHGALLEGLRTLRGQFPPRGQLALTGHAHLDLGWLWPVHETRRKARRTLHTVTNLMERFSDFTFNQSSAQLFAWLEQDDPALFTRVQAQVAGGRLEPVGGMWVEPDCQMTGGESLARQLLYGQTYFRRAFGRTCEVAWLPDTFGFTPALPQLLAQAGVTGFFTTKLNWNEETPFPHDLFWWQGLDGTRVLSHSLNNPGGSRPGLGGYNGDVRPGDLLGTWERFGAKTSRAWQSRSPESLFTFGYGDGGGGPSEAMLHAYDTLKAFPALPALRMTRVDDFYRTLPRDGLPVWVGELYLQLHRGTLTSQAAIKRLNRQAEHRLLELEALAALHPASPATPGETDGLWQTTLLNQFHDILPGSSIHEVYRDALPELTHVTGRAAELTRAHWQPQDGSWTVFNAATWPRPLSVTLPGVTGGAVSLDGQVLPGQPVEDGLLVHAPHVHVPALGQLTLRLDPAAEPAEPAGTVRAWQDGERVMLEHATLRAEFNRDGHLIRLLDRAANREALGPDGHRLVAYPDLPYAWDAWDVARDLGTDGEPLSGPCTVQITARGPLRAAVRVTRQWRDSAVTQDFTLDAGQHQLNVTLHADWRERHTLLRAETSLNVHAHEAWAETAMGAQPRPTHRNTPADAAQFEVSAHRWLDLSEPGFGVSLLNDGRYGHSTLGDKAALSVARGPMWPDPQADLGAHDVQYALYPHRGDWRAAHTPRAGFDLNSPLLAHPGRLDLRFPPTLSGLDVMLSSLKPAQDGRGVILRVYEAHGQRGTLTLNAGHFSAAQPVNLLEDPLGPAHPAAALEVPVRPYEILSFRLT
ncbi:glycoside hydrolase family 38 C-terminal domain-containing protein [Deinococcus radiotolerans]|uniref:Alpha-mannosidase n=1 Tax=Deinococcus radiotolerans TaxID=1309407 RepID=A0ABQ2FLC8_9DEIO|nr:glycoside hydrolase family 38 C-terminal domain-containing protein [Deinococcus radiotolerans]GGK99452.1 alpha-mannosidase [Deinococcus radiotolerans]